MLTYYQRYAGISRESRYRVLSGFFGLSNPGIRWEGSEDCQAFPIPFHAVNALFDVDRNHRAQLGGGRRQRSRDAWGVGVEIGLTSGDGQARSFVPRQAYLTFPM